MKQETPRKNQLPLLGALLVVLIVGSLIFSAVNHRAPDDGGLTASQQKIMDRMSAIAQQSGGDWNKVSPADRDFLIQVPGGKSEVTARALLAREAKAMPQSTSNAAKL